MTVWGASYLAYMGKIPSLACISFRRRFAIYLTLCGTYLMSLCSSQSTGNRRTLPYLNHRLLGNLRSRFRLAREFSKTKILIDAISPSSFPVRVE